MKLLDLSRSALAHPCAPSWRSWYDLEQAKLATFASARGLAFAPIVNAFAALSPQTSVARNWQMLAELVDQGSTRGLGAPIRAARVCLDGGALKSGPKVLAFADALLGAHDAVVVDRWAARAAGDLLPTTPKRYAHIANQYRETAVAIGGISPRDLQAVTWCFLRGKAD